MACGCGRAIQKKCPDGYHIDEKRGACVNNETGEVYTRPTTVNPDTATRTRRTQMPTTPSRRGVGTSHNVEGYKGRGEDIEFEDEQKPKSKYEIPEEQAKAIKQNMKKVKAYLQRLARDKKFAPILLPFTTYYIAYDFCVQKSAEYQAKAKTEQQKTLAEEYSKTMDEILKSVPEVDFDNLDPEDAVKLAHKYDAESRQKMEKYKQLAQKKGKKSIEYARYRAYADYVKMCEDVQEKLKVRIEMKQRAKRKMEQLQGQRSNFGHN